MIVLVGVRLQDRVETRPGIGGKKTLKSGAGIPGMECCPIETEWRLQTSYR
jgi:hypothetical protein